MRFYAFIIVLILSLLPMTTWADNILRKIEVNGSLVYLSFDRDIDQHEVSIDFSDQEIQLNLDHTLVHPAKNIPVKHGPLNQIFAYQLSPKMVRCRLNLRESVQDLKQRVELKTQGRRLQLKFFDAPVYPPESQNMMQTSVVQNPSLERAEASPIHEAHASVDTKANALAENALEEKIVHSEVKDSALSDQKLPQSVSKDGSDVIKPLPTMSSVLFKLFFVTLLVVGVAGLLKLLKSHSLKFNSPWLKSLQNLSQTHFGQEGQHVKVIGTHFIGPKKSLVTVKVGGQTLLLGVTDHSIQIITRLDSVDEIPGGVGSAEVSFDETLHAESESGIRSRIRSRLEGLKPL